MELLEKIKPKCLRDFIGSKIQIKKLEELLNDKSKHFIVLLGPDGSGKTTLMNLLLQPKNFNILDVNKDYNTSKEMTNTITTFCNSKTIESFFNKKRKCILVDGFESLINYDRYFLSTLMSCFDTVTKADGLFVILSNNSEEKRLVETKKNPEIVKISYPQQRDCFAYLMNKELDVDDEVLFNLVKEHKASIRDIIMNLHTDFIKDGMMYKDMNNFEIVKKMLQHGCTLDSVEQFKEDTSLVSFMFYENCPEHICLNMEGTWEEKMQTYLAINNNMIMSCVFESYIYDTQNFGFYELINMMRLYGNSHNLSNLTKKPGTPKDYKMRFSQILSKVSHKNIMNKKIKNIMSTNSNLSYHNLYIMSDAISKKCLKYKGTTDESNFISTYDKYFT